ncbi:hypothetical protein ACFL0X_03030 [Nanoarchaeota archaeon]
MIYSNVKRFIELQVNPNFREDNIRRIYDFVQRDSRVRGREDESYEDFRDYLSNFLIRDHNEVERADLGKMYFPETWSLRGSGNYPLMIVGGKEGFDRICGVLKSGEAGFRPSVRSFKDESDCSRSYPDSKEASEILVLEYPGEVQGYLEFYGRGLKYELGSKLLFGDHRKGTINFDTVFRHYDTRWDRKGERFINLFRFLMQNGFQFVYDPHQDKGIPIVCHL